MKENIIYFRKSGINHKGLFMRKSAGTSKIYKVCKKIKFIRATSGAIIDTNYKWTSNNVKVEIKFKNLTTSSATIFGSEDRINESTETSGQYSTIGHTSMYNGLRMAWYIGKEAVLGLSDSYPTTDIHTMSIETNEENSRIICTIDGNSQTYTNANAVIVNKTISNSIFGSHWNDSYSQFAPCDVYYCKMWDNGNLVRDLYPIKNGQIINGITSTVDGFYDRVRHEFYSNITNDGSITYIEE